MKCSIFFSVASLAAWVVVVAAEAVLDVPDFIEPLDHKKSSSISQLIKGKSRDLQELLKYFNETTI